MQENTEEGGEDAGEATAGEATEGKADDFGERGPPPRRLAEDASSATRSKVPARPASAASPSDSLASIPEQARAAVELANKRFTLLLDAIDSPVYVADMQTYELLYVNRKVREQFGDVEGQLCWQAIQQGQGGPCAFCTNDRLIDPRGEPAGPYIWDAYNTALDRWFHCIDRAVRWDDGRLVRVEIAIDITERKRAEESSAYRADLQSTLADISAELLDATERGFWDAMRRSMAMMRRRLGADGAFVGLFDHASASLSLHDLWPGEAASDATYRQAYADLPDLLEAWRAGRLLTIEGAAAMGDGLRQELSLIGLSGFGSIILAPLSYGGDLCLLAGFGVRASQRPWRDDERHVVQVLANLIGNALGRQKTLDALRSSREQLQSLAFNDPLTGLANRRLLIDRMRMAAAAADRSGRLFAVCYLDLDAFKPVNDQCGHEAGDLLLKQVAHRLRAGTRPTDTVARWGGDEFALVLSDLPGVDTCEQTLERLRRALHSPYRLDQGEFTVSASIGVSLYPRDGGDGEALLRRADQALYLAKQAGGNRVQFFEPDKDRALLAHRARLTRIEQALALDELRVLYQPIIDMRYGQLIGVEALIRWQHPERGLLGPDAFLPLVEGDDLSRRLDLWVVATALGDLATWSSTGADLRLSINVAANSVLSPGFAQSVKALLDRHPGLSSAAIDLEVRESAAINDLDTIAAVVEEAETLGLSFSIDDFGTGNASFASFRHLRARTLKIHQSLVGGMLDNHLDLSVVASVIGVAHAFDHGVIAEGLETSEQGSLLLDLGCDLAQGYFIAHPMPADALLEWFKGYRPPPQWAAAANAWTPVDLPLLLLEPQQRGWLQQLELTLLGDAEQGPALPEPAACQLRRWYASDGQRRYGPYAAFTALGPLLDQVEQVASELARRRAGGEQLTTDSLAQLRGANDAILAQLKALRDQVTASRMQ